MDDVDGGGMLVLLRAETVVFRLVIPAPCAWIRPQSCAFQQVGLTPFDRETRFATQTNQEQEDLGARLVAALQALMDRQVFPFLAVIRCRNFRSDDLMRSGDWPGSAYRVHPHHIRIEEPNGTLAVLPPLV